MENFQSPWAITLLKVSKHFQNLKMFGFILSLYISRGREIVIASYWYSFCLFFFFLDCSRKKLACVPPPLENRYMYFKVKFNKRGPI